LLESLEQDPNIEIIPMTEGLYKRGFELYQSRPDKEWGITDCISFVVMQERSIMEALTTDKHFEQAGFQALLR
jgi:predicted nucleic acid-binding protein